MGAFLARPIAGSWPFPWLDATYGKARDSGRVVTKACVLAVGVNEAGRREVLGLAVGPAKTEKFWSAFLRDLVGRGLAGVELAISDAHQGLGQAIGRILGASWQRCRLHFMRDVRAHMQRRQSPAMNTIPRPRQRHRCVTPGVALAQYWAVALQSSSTMPGAPLSAHACMNRWSRAPMPRAPKAVAFRLCSCSPRQWLDLNGYGARRRASVARARRTPAPH